MDIFGIGLPEIIFVMILALIIMGPKDMAKAGRTIGRSLRRLVTSENWRTIQDASREIRNLPNRLMREAGIEDLEKELPSASVIRRELGVDDMKRDIDQWQKDLSDWTTQPTIGTPEDSPETILPKTSPGKPPAPVTPPAPPVDPAASNPDETGGASATGQN